MKITDNMRLNWLDDKTANLLWLGGARQGQCEVIGQIPERLVPGFGRTSRQAIDAAIKAELRRKKKP